MTKAQLSDIEQQFWKEYIQADALQRQEKIAVIVETIDGTRFIEDDDIRARVLSSLLQNYFDDLVGAK